MAGCFVDEALTTGAVVVMNANAGTSNVTLAVGNAAGEAGAVTAKLPPHSVRTFTFALFK